MPIHKKYLLSFLLSFFLVMVAGTATSCKSAAAPLQSSKETISTKEVTTVERDTTFKTPADSSQFIGHLVEKNGIIEMAQAVSKRPGKYLELPTVTIKDNILTVDCNAKAQELFAKWQETYTKEHTATIETIPYPVERQLTWWQTTQIWCGRLLLLAFLILIADLLYTYLKPKKSA